MAEHTAGLPSFAPLLPAIDLQAGRPSAVVLHAKHGMSVFHIPCRVLSTTVDMQAAETVHSASLLCHVCPEYHFGMSRTILPESLSVPYQRKKGTCGPKYASLPPFMLVAMTKSRCGEKLSVMVNTTDHS